MTRRPVELDLQVEFDRPTGLLGLFNLQAHLEELLGCPVDLGTPASLKPRVRQRVMAEVVYVNWRADRAQHGFSNPVGYRSG